MCETRFSRQGITFLFEIKLSEKEINEDYKHETKAHYWRFKRDLRTPLSLSLSLSLTLARDRNKVDYYKCSPGHNARPRLDRKLLPVRINLTLLPSQPALVGEDFPRSLSNIRNPKEGCGLESVDA